MRHHVVGLLLGATLVVCAPAGAEDLLLLREGHQVVEGSSILRAGDSYEVQLASGETLTVPAAGVERFVPGTTFLAWMARREAELTPDNHQGHSQLLQYALHSAHAAEAQELATRISPRFPDDPFMYGAARLGHGALDPERWILFDYHEDVVLWLEEEGTDTPRYTMPVEDFRYEVNFHKHALNHGYTILGFHFFAKERGLFPVLQDAEGNLPAGWPEGMVPAWTLEGQLAIHEASPNRFFDRVVQYIFHAVLEFGIHRTARPEDTIFTYSAWRAGKHGSRAEAALERGSRKLFIDTLKDARLHYCPQLRQLPEGVTYMEEMHAPRPPLFDPEPHYTFTRREQPPGEEEVVPPEETPPPAEVPTPQPPPDEPPPDQDQSAGWR